MQDCSKMQEMNIMNEHAAVKSATSRMGKMRHASKRNAEILYEEGPGRKRPRSVLELPVDHPDRKKSRKLENAYLSRFRKTSYTCLLEEECSRVQSVTKELRTHKSALEKEREELLIETDRLAELIKLANEHISLEVIPDDERKPVPMSAVTDAESDDSDYLFESFYFSSDSPSQDVPSSHPSQVDDSQIAFYENWNSTFTDEQPRIAFQDMCTQDVFGIDESTNEASGTTEDLTLVFDEEYPEWKLAPMVSHELSLPSWQDVLCEIIPARMDRTA